MDYSVERNLIIEKLRCERSRSFMKMKDCTTKCSKLSNARRLEGNKLYSEKDYDKRLEEIFKLYTESIAYAPCGSEDLAFAYGNRSAILQRMNKYKESILDIDRAVKISNNAVFKVKWLCRKIECMVEQGLPDCIHVYDEVKSLLSEIDNQNNNDNKTYEKVQKAKNALNNLKKPPVKKPPVKKEKIPKHMLILSKKEKENVFNSISLRGNNKCNKHFVAEEDIVPGEIIFVEEPYVSCLNLNNFHFYCGHCFTKSWANIPCDYCNWCMFCSEKCKELAWMNYHDIECTTVSYFTHFRKIDYYDHLSLRCLLKGIKEFTSIYSFKTHTENVDDLMALGIAPDEPNYQRNVFKNVYALYDKVPENLFKESVLNSVIILISLCKFTSFFGQHLKFEDTEDLIKNPNVIFIGCLLLRLKKKCFRSTHIMNDINMICKQSNDLITYQTYNDCSKGACVVPLTHFINYSCYPNVRKCMTNDNKLIVFSLRPIKKNTPLLMEYQYTFFEVPRQLRRTSINMNCMCDACKNDWPTLAEMYKMPKEKPLLYAKSYKQNESDLFDENDALVRPIINLHGKARIDQTTVTQLATAMEKALKHLDQPSVVICELMICLSMAFDKLYNSDVTC